MSQAKAVLVKGASRLQGIGAVACLALAKAGYDVFFQCWPAYDEQQSWGYSKGDPDQLKKSTVALGSKCESLQIDLTQSDTPNQFLDAAFSCFSYLNVLVNTAAHSSPLPLKEVTGQVLDQHYQLNIRPTTFLLCVEFSKRYQLKNGGRIINLASGQSLGAMTQEIACALTKGALQTLTSTLSTLLMGRGIPSMLLPRC